MYYTCYKWIIKRTIILIIFVNIGISINRIPFFFSLQTCIRFSLMTGISLMQSVDWVALPLNTPANILIFTINMRTFNHFFGSCVNCTNQLSISYRIIDGNEGNYFSLRGGFDYNMIVYTERRLTTPKAKYRLQILTRVRRELAEMHFYHSLTVFVSEFDF